MSCLKEAVPNNRRVTDLDTANSLLNELIGDENGMYNITGRDATRRVYHVLSQWVDFGSRDLQ